MKETSVSYAPPVVRVVNVKVEKGFATSTDQKSYDHFNGSIGGMKWN